MYQISNHCSQFFSFILYLQLGAKPKTNDPVLEVKTLCKALGNVTIVQKGQSDIISDGENGRSKSKGH